MYLKHVDCYSVSNRSQTESCLMLSHCFIAHNNTIQHFEIDRIFIHMYMKGNRKTRFYNSSENVRGLFKK